MVRYFPLPRIIVISLLFTVYSLNVIADAPQPGANSGPQYTEQSAAQPFNKTEALPQSASGSQRDDEEPPARVLDNMVSHVSHWVTEIMGFGLVGLILALFFTPILRHRLDRLIERLLSVFDTSLNNNAMPIVQNGLKEGFEKASSSFADVFTQSINEKVIPLIIHSMDETGRHIKSVVDGLIPVDTSKKEESPNVIADLQAYVDAGDIDGVYKKVEREKDLSEKILQYKELAKIFMRNKDKHNSIVAVHKFGEIGGETPEKYALLAYVYWWYGDIDTAIVHGETGLKLSLSLNESASKEEALLRLKNSLAYYYTQKGINKEIALSYIEEILSKTHPESESYVPRLHTQGFWFLQFGNTPEDMDRAIECFNKVLETEPADTFAIQHLQAAYAKKKEMPKK